MAESNHLEMIADLCLAIRLTKSSAIGYDVVPALGIVA